MPQTMTKKELDALLRAQQGELDAVLMYRALADAVRSEKDAAVFRQLAAEEGGHAAVFRDLSHVTLQPKKLKSVLLPVLYKLLGRKRLYPLIAKGEYAADRSYRALAARFPETETVKRDEKRHGDAVLALLRDA